MKTKTWNRIIALILVFSLVLSIPLMRGQSLEVYADDQRTTMEVSDSETGTEDCAIDSDNNFATAAYSEESVDVAYGDVDSSENVDAADALVILKIAARFFPATMEQSSVGDVDGSDSIDALDALYVLKKAAKIIEIFPIEPHTHVWRDADCFNPITCQLCGKTEGSPLGHLVEVGICRRCNTVQNLDLILTICTDISNWMHAAVEAYEIFTTADMDSPFERWSKSYEAQIHLDNAMYYYYDIIARCGSYTELQIFKQYAENFRVMMPRRVGSSVNKIEYLLLIEDYGKLFKEAGIILDYVSDYLEELKAVVL